MSTTDLLIGHLDNFKSMSEAEIKKDKRWVKKVAGRLTPLDKMTAKDKADFTRRMNATFPKK